MALRSILPHSRATYEIVLRGSLAHTQRAWFGPALISCHADGTTTLTIVVADQAALHGVLNRIRDLGLVLIAVHLLDPALL